jgi:hypothetical protein
MNSAGLYILIVYRRHSTICFNYDSHLRVRRHFCSSLRRAGKVLRDDILHICSQKGS